MNNHKNVLIGSAGTGTAFAAVCALRRVWSQSVKVVAMDINPRHLITASLLTDHFEQVPLFSESEFPATLLRILQHYKVDTYLPLFPEEIALAVRLREEGQIPTSITVMAPPLAACEACADKWILSQLLMKHGVPVPRTASADEPFSATEFFLKPKDGTGSRGARIVKATELPGLVGGSADKWIVQEICTAPEVTVDVFINKASKFQYVLCRERVEIKTGVSTKSRIFMDEKLGGFARIIAEILNLQGSFCFQVMRNSTGWVVTDVNPRPGAATAMCVVTGNDFFAASFASYWGEDFRRFFRPLDGEQFVTRQYAEFLMGPSI
jgi:carbamoylphosphate synthase large subunit